MGGSPALTAPSLPASRCRRSTSCLSSVTAFASFSGNCRSRWVHKCHLGIGASGTDCCCRACTPRCSLPPPSPMTHKHVCLTRSCSALRPPPSVHHSLPVCRASTPSCTSRTRTLGRQCRWYPRPPSLGRAFRTCCCCWFGWRRYHSTHHIKRGDGTFLGRHLSPTPPPLPFP